MTKLRNAIKTCAAAAIVASLIYYAIAYTVFSWRNPELTDRQILLLFWDVMTWS